MCTVSKTRKGKETEAPKKKATVLTCWFLPVRTLLDFWPIVLSDNSPVGLSIEGKKDVFIGSSMKWWVRACISVYGSSAGSSLTEVCE